MTRIEEKPEVTLGRMIREAGLPEPVPQYRFCPWRQFRADYGWPPPVKVLLEYEGATWRPHRGHSSGAGIRRDVEKQNIASYLGYRVFRVTVDMLRDDAEMADLFEMIREHVAKRISREAILSMFLNLRSDGVGNKGGGTDGGE